MMIPAILVLLVAALVAVDSTGAKQKEQTLVSDIPPYSQRGNIPPKISSEIERFLSNTTCGLDKNCWLSKLNTTPYPNGPARSQRKSPLRMIREIHPDSKLQSDHGVKKLYWGSKWHTTSQPNDEEERFHRNSSLRMTREIHHEAIIGLDNSNWGHKWSTTRQPSDQKKIHSDSSPKMAHEIRHEAVNGLNKMHWETFNTSTMPPSGTARGINHNSSSKAVGVLKGQKPVHRILGGRKASIEEYPSMLSVWITADNGTSYYVCGGTILSEYWALTAAHCVMDSKPPRVTMRAGSYSKGNKTTDHPAEKIIIHDQFTLREGLEFFIKDDVAVIKVKEGFPLNNKTVNAAKLPRPGQVISSGTTATAVGWGESENSNGIPDILQAADLKIISKEMCANLWFKQGAKLVKDSILCSQDSSKRFCGGDSGSPLFADGDVVGVASAHLDVCIKTDLPGVHMDVAYFKNWITRKTGVK